MSFIFKKRTAATVPQPQAGKLALFVDSTDGITKTKDENGTVVSLIPAAYNDESAQDAIGNALVDTNSIDFTYDDVANAISAVMRLTYGTDVVAASKTFVKADHGLGIRMSNGGTAMTVTLPALTAGDNGWWVKVDNIDATAAITVSTTGGTAQFGTASATTYTLQPLCRQTFVWTGSRWTFDSGNANLMKSPLAGTMANGQLPVFTDAIGRTMGVATPAQVSAAGAAATTALQGMMSASDKNHMSNFFGNGWFNVQDHGVSPANSAAANVTALNLLLQTTAPANSVIYFPPGTYQFNAALTTLTKDFFFYGVRGFTTIALTANIAGNFLTLDNTGFYTTLYGLYFANFALQTAGYVISCQNDVNVMIQDCFFVGAGANLLSGGIDFTGTNSGNGGVLRNVYIAGFNGTGINVASALDSLYLQDLEIVNNAGGSASVGLGCTNGGALVMVDCQIILCGINVLLNPTAGITVASMFASNCFFDQGRTICMSITGPGTVTRSHFDACWFTLASTAVNAQAVNISTTAASAHTGLMFSGCHILNTPTATTSDGLVVTASGDLTVIGCQIAGFVNGINITPSTATPTILNIGNNTIGTTGGVPANTTGIRLNAGTTTYGQIVVQGNSFFGNTNPLIDNSTVPASGMKLIDGNAGMALPVAAKIAASAAINTTETYVLTAIPLPANSLTVGTTIRANLVGTTTSTAANVSTFTVRVGTSGTTPASDTVATAALATSAAALSGTNNPFTAQILITCRAIGASTVLECALTVVNNGVTGIMSVASAVAVVATGAFSNTAAEFLNISYKSAATTTTTTFQLAAWEVLAQ